MRKYLVTLPRFSTQDPVNATIMTGGELKALLNDRNNTLPTGIYRLDAIKEPMRLYLTKIKGSWLLQDRFGAIECLEGGA